MPFTTASRRGALAGRSRTLGSGALFGSLGAVLRTALLAVLHTLRIEHAAQDVIAHAGKVAHTAAADQHDAVLLEVVAFAGDIGDDFALVGQTDLGDLAERRVRLFRRRRIDRKSTRLNSSH